MVRINSTRWCFPRYMKRVPVSISTSITVSSPCFFFGRGAGLRSKSSPFVSAPSFPFLLAARVFMRRDPLLPVTTTLAFDFAFCVFLAATGFLVFSIVADASSLSWDSSTRPSAFSEITSSSCDPSTETIQCVTSPEPRASSSSLESRMPTSIPPTRTT